MPRLTEAMKDVISCEKLWGTANKYWFIDVRIGKPDTSKKYRIALTQGTETSKYLKEKITIVIPQVVASERGSALNYYII